MNVGKYAGVAIDKLPNSYLRWMVSQDFPKEWVRIARKKLEASDYYNDPLNVTRHAIDSFSKRFLNLWVMHMKETKGEGMGLASFLAHTAKEAWTKGTISHGPRFAGDSLRRDYKGIRYVFSVSPHYSDLLDLITVMEID